MTPDEDGQTLRILAWADRVLSAEVLHSDAEALRSARFLASAVVIAAVICLAYSVFHVRAGETLRGVFVAAGIAPILFSLVLLRRPERLVGATHYVAAVVLAVVLISHFLSVETPRVFLGAIAIPFIAAAAGGVRVGLFWTAVVTIVLAWGAGTLELTDGERWLAWNSVIVTITTGAGASLFEGARQCAMRRVGRIREQVEQHVSKRAEVEEALESSQVLFAKAFQKAPSILILSELATGRITDVNESFTRTAGWRADEAIGRTLTELRAWGSIEDRDRLFEHVLNEGSAGGVEVCFRTRSGEKIWMLASAEVLDLGGRAHVLALGVDITERKRADEALDRYRRLLEEHVEERGEQLRASRAKLREQQQLAAIGTLAAGIAHQINNPIGGIMAAAELALLKDGEPDREEVRTRALMTAVEEANRCGRIVRNMLKFSRHEPTAKWVEDLNGIVRRSAELTRSYVVGAGGTLELDLESGTIEARVSPIDFEQVLVNLIRNAAESSPEGAKVVVSTRRIGDAAWIEVIDDGDGIALADQDQVFDPFFTTRLASGGSGLGLSVAQGIVSDHGGMLDIHSQPEQGTCVVVRIPLDPVGSSDSGRSDGPAGWSAADRPTDGQRVDRSSLQGPFFR